MTTIITQIFIKSQVYGVEVKDISMARLAAYTNVIVIDYITRRCVIMEPNVVVVVVVVLVLVVVIRKCSRCRNANTTLQSKPVFHIYKQIITHLLL